MPELNEKQELETLRRKSRYLEVLHEFALSQVNLNSLDEILWNVAKTAIAKLGFVDCVIYLLDSDNSVLHRIFSTLLPFRLEKASSVRSPGPERSNSSLIPAKIPVILSMIHLGCPNWRCPLFIRDRSLGFLIPSIRTRGFLLKITCSY